MEIHIVAPAIPLSIGPFINLTVRMKNYGRSATTIVNVKVGDASGRKHDDITWPERHNQTRLIQAQLAILEVSNCDDHAKSLILAISMAQRCDIEVDNDREKRVCNRMNVPRKGLCIEAEIPKLLRK